LISAVIVAILPNIIFFILFFKTTEFKCLLQRIKGIINRRLKNG
jgi:hypothetical protein